MKTISSTTLQNHFGEYLEISRMEPVLVSRSGRPVAVVISFNEYERLREMEDAYWGKKAVRAEKEGYLGSAKSMMLLKKKLHA